MGGNDLFEIRISFPLAIFPGAGLVDRVVVAFLSSEEAPHCFLQWRHRSPSCQQSARVPLAHPHPFPAPLRLGSGWCCHLEVGARHHFASYLQRQPLRWLPFSALGLRAEGGAAWERPK